AELDALGPLGRLQRPLALDSREHGVLRVAEDEEDGVALRAELLAAGGPGRLAEEPLVLGEDLGVAVLEAPQERRRALDVGEEERDGAGREIHARRIQPQRRDLLDRQARPKPVPALRPRAGLELAAVYGDALAHPDEAVSSLVAVSAAGAVVAHRQLDVAVGVADEHLGFSRAGVLERVRES